MQNLNADTGVKNKSRADGKNIYEYYTVKNDYSIEINKKDKEGNKDLSSSHRVLEKMKAEIFCPGK